MSKQVDVIGFLRKLVDTYDSLSVSDAYAAAQLPKAVAARAAISELIEAAQFALDKAWEYGEEEPHFVRLNAALAAIRSGEK